jgi:hypothetical protein
MLGNIMKVNMSVAEKVIAEYTKSPVSRSTKRICWGCGSEDHMYAIKNTIVCPNKDLPGVQEKAAKVRMDFNERRRALKKKRKSNESDDRKQDKSDKRIATIADIKAMLSQQSSPSKQSHFVLSTSCTKESAKSPGQSQLLSSQFRQSMETKPQFNAIKKETWINNMDKLSLEEEEEDLPSCNTVTAFASDNIKPPLPIQFDSNLPHINFDIGTDNQKSFQINIAYDTCAVLNVGYAGYHLTIAKSFPSVVKSLTWAEKEYSPLVLSGIVKSADDNSKVNPDQSTFTTTLPAIIEYFTPYKTTEGAPVTLKIALGNNVGVNTILGLSTIKNARLSLDLDSNIFQAGILDQKPFDIIFKPTSRGIPDISPFKAHPCILELTKESPIIAEVNECYNAVFKNNDTDTEMSDTIKDADDVTDQDMEIPKVSWLDKQAQSTYPNTFM